MAGELHLRTYVQDLDIRQDGGFHVAEGLCVPFDTEAEIAEPRRDGVIRYRELFRAGAFARAVRAPFRVPLLYGHGPGESLDQRLGFGTEFRESAEGLVGVFRLDRSRAEHALDILTTSHRALSVGFLSVWPKPGTERAGELVVRTSVALDHVAAVVEPAYALAGVTSVRGTPDDDTPTDADRQAEQQQQQDRELMAWFGEHDKYGD